VLATHFFQIIDEAFNGEYLEHRPILKNFSLMIFDKLHYIMRWNKNSPTVLTTGIQQMVLLFGRDAIFCVSTHLDWE